MRRQGMHVPTPYSEVVNAYVRAYALAQQSAYSSAYGYDPTTHWRYLMQQESYNQFSEFHHDQLEQSFGKEGLYKTAICREFADTGKCRRNEKCTYAHGDHELRERPNALAHRNSYKTKLCRNWTETGYCPYKERCLFAHGNADRRVRSSNDDHATSTAAVAAGAMTSEASIGPHKSTVAVQSGAQQQATTNDTSEASKISKSEVLCATFTESGVCAASGGCSDVHELQAHEAYRVLNGQRKAADIGVNKYIIKANADDDATVPKRPKLTSIEDSSDMVECFGTFGGHVAKRLCDMSTVKAVQTMHAIITALERFGE